jgi:hypothetical protein
MSFRHHQGRDVTAPLTVLIWSPATMDNAAREKRRQAFNVLLDGFSWTSIFFPDQAEVKLHLSHNATVLSKANYLRQKFGQNAFSTIYYAHDISADFIAQSAMQAFPTATRVCFGDALGVVYNNDYFTDHTYPVNVTELVSRPMQTIRNVLFRLKRRWTLPSRSRCLDADYTVLILPCDPGGDFLVGKKLLPANNDYLHYVLTTLSSAAERHLKQEPVKETGISDKNVVMLLGSYSESCLTTEEQECAMYVEAARLHVLPESKIILKAHPASREEKVLRIQQALSLHYGTVVIYNDELPIEVMSWLVNYANIISFSYSSVSLLYLYGSPVLHAMNNTLISLFFPKETQTWMLESNKLYLEQLAIAKQLREVYACQK